MTDGSPLSSPAIGASNNDLIRPCPESTLRAAEPPLPPREPAVAVALSGGGFRATLSGLGVLRFLADAGMLDQVRHVSSVSGGSVANGMFATRYEEVARAQFSSSAFDEHVVHPLVDLVSEQSVFVNLVRQSWKILGRPTRTDLLADEFDRQLFRGRLLEELSNGCRFIFNAANITTGVRFGFERDVLGDYALGLTSTDGSGIRVAEAVAASAAVPGLLAPLVIDQVRFPCQQGRTVRLVDGGAYDNMGLESVDGLDKALLVAINSGGLFRTKKYGVVPIIRDLQVAQSLLYRQSTALRRRWMVERFKVWERARDSGQPSPEWGRRGVLFGLATTMTPTAAWSQANPEVPDVERVSTVETSFNRFPRQLCRDLVHAGWWLTGASLTAYHPELFPGPPPQWREL